MYQIGEFSKICHVTVKTLRHYDKIGLLKPSVVDRFTSYRYYDRSQLKKMLLIQKLKRYAFSLEEIQALLLCNQNAFHEALLRQREKLERKQMELGTVLHELTLHLQTLERTGEMMNLQNGYTVKLLRTPPMAVLSCRHQMGVDEFGRYYSTLYERAAKDRVTPNGVVGAMYHDAEFHPDSSDIELFLGIREQERADRALEARQCAMALHRGAYSTLNETYAALVSWIENNGYEWTDAPYEIYTKTARDGLSPVDWETEIYFPIRKREGNPSEQESASQS